MVQKQSLRKNTDYQQIIWVCFPIFNLTVRKAFEKSVSVMVIEM